MANKMAADIRRQLGPNGLQPHKSVITGPKVGPGGVPISSNLGRRGAKPTTVSSLHGAARDFGAMQNNHRVSPSGRSGSKDGDLMSSMVARLQKLEALNLTLKSELREKTTKIISLDDENGRLRLAAADDAVDQIARLTVERDNYKSQTVEMMKFLSDYGLKWVGGDGGQREGNFDSKGIKEELKHQGPAFRNNVPSEIDTEVLTRRIEELNFIAEK